MEEYNAALKNILDVTKDEENNNKNFNNFVIIYED